MHVPRPACAVFAGQVDAAHVQVLPYDFATFDNFDEPAMRSVNVCRMLVAAFLSRFTNLRDGATY